MIRFTDLSKARKSRHFRIAFAVLLLVLVSLASLFLVDHFNAKAGAGSSTLPNAYVGDQKCQSCHASEYAAWKSSDHFKAMLPADDSTVLGDFNETSYSADGVTSTFFKKGNEFYINTQGPDGQQHDYKVLYSFGHYPLRQYLVAFPGGRMQVPRVSWDVKKKKWFHQYAGQKIDPADWLHWTRDAQNWNTMCAACHSTDLRKNYDMEKDSYQTTFSSINVSCESCHGPGKNHLDLVSTEAFKKGGGGQGSYINRLSSQKEQVNTCAPCHSLKGEIGSGFVHSGELLDNYIPQLPAPEHFYADGQVKDEDYTYASFLQSRMYRHGVSCGNCHEPHTGKVLFTGNQLCLQCHNSRYDSPAHHFHEVNSEGAACKNCHMPGKTFMGNDFRHDHSLRVPRPDLTVLYGTPNACNNCHTGKSPQWAVRVVEQLYGNKRKYHFAEDLSPGSRLDDQSEVHLIKLLSDTATPAIIRATAISYLGSIFTPGSVAALRKSLQDPDALTRYYALRSLSNFPPVQWLEEAAPLLADKVRAVRIAAADLFSSIPDEQVSQNYQAALVQAKEELRRYLFYQADFADGNIMIGDHYLRANDYNNAQRFYLRALKKDSLLNYARLNLSVAFSATGKNDQALEVLETAARISPRNDRVYFNLALLLAGEKDTAGAMRNFEKAYVLQSKNPRLYYNYGILLFQKGRVNKAEEVLLKGMAISPGEEDLDYALAYVYTQTKKYEKARKYILILRQRNPGRPEYQSLFQLLQP